MPDNNIDKLIAFLSDPDQDKTGVHKFITDALQDLNALAGSDDFASETERAVNALQQYDQGQYAQIITDYAQNPSDEALVTANRNVMIAAMADARQAATEAAANVEAPEIEDAPAAMDDQEMAEHMARVEEQLRAITPEYIEQKFDEALVSPEVQAEMERRGINPDDVIERKPELVEKMHGGMQELIEMLPDLMEEGEAKAHEQIEQAIENFPQMFDDALASELAETMEAADQRMQRKFDVAASELAEAREFQANGELPDNPDSELVQKHDQAVIDMADNLMQMRSVDPNGFEAMKGVISSQGEMGEQVMELVNQRIAAENAASEVVPVPGGMGNQQ